MKGISLPIFTLSLELGSEVNKNHKNRTHVGHGRQKEKTDYPECGNFLSSQDSLSLHQIHIIAN